MHDSDDREEGKNETPEERKQRFLNKWASVIENDAKLIAEEEPEQRPLSRAYLSLCPQNRATNK
jgi:hypothetical protein